MKLTACYGYYAVAFQPVDCTPCSSHCEMLGEVSVKISISKSDLNFF